MRPEMTSSIARLVSSRRKQVKLPLKLYYAENVFRRHHVLRKQEFLQLGVEYLGDDSVDADVEMIRLGIEIMLSLGIQGFRISIGHAENVSQYKPQEIEALMKREFYRLDRIPLIGDMSILRQNTRLKLIADVFNQKYPNYTQYIKYDLGLVKEITYYTGIIFNIMVEGVGYIIGTGGRYNQLLKQYGWDIPAIGFVVEFDKLAHYFTND